MPSYCGIHAAILLLLFSSQVFPKAGTEETAGRSGPSRCGAKCKTQAWGPSEQCLYDVIVLSQPCYDLSVEDVLAKWTT